MAQTRRRRKHRGTQSGSIDRRGRRARPRSRQEARARAKQRMGTKRDRAADLVERGDQGPARRRGLPRAAGDALRSATRSGRWRCPSACWRSTSPWATSSTASSTAAARRPPGASASVRTGRVGAPGRYPQRGYGRSLLHRRPGCRELLHRAPRRRRSRADRRPGRRGRPDPGGGGEARDRDRGDPADALPLRPHRRRRPGGEGDRGARVLPRDRGAGARRHHVLRPLAGVRPLRELRGRRDGCRRRAPGCRGPRDRRHLHPRSQPGPRHLRDP